MPAMPSASFCLTHIGELVTMSAPGRSGPVCPSWAEEITLIQDAFLWVGDGMIVDFGPMAQCPAQPEIPCIDAHGKTVLPGWVDPHTHLIFAGSREHELVERIRKARQISKGDRMAGGIQYTVQCTRQATDAELLASTLKRMERLLGYGTTTAEAKSGYGLSPEHEIRLLQILKQASRQHPLELAPTFLGAHAFPTDMSRADYLQSILDTLPLIAEQQLAEFCDVFCEQGFFTFNESQTILQKAQAVGLKLRLHADELSDTDGAWLAGELKACSADHLQFASRKGLQHMKDHGTIAVLLPGTAFYLGLPYPQTATMRELDLPMALSTDLNPGGCYCESMLLMITLACTQMQLLPIEALAAATINGAHALNRGDRIGSIEIGKQADLIMLDAPNHAYIPYHFGVNLVTDVCKKGHWLIASESSQTTEKAG